MRKSHKQKIRDKRRWRFLERWAKRAAKEISDEIDREFIRQLSEKSQFYFDKQSLV